MLVFALVCTGLFACDKESGDYDYLFKKDDGDLYVRYFVGGNGETWLHEIAHNFVQETGINVYLEADYDVTAEIPTILKNTHPSSGTPSASLLKTLPDVAMTQTIRWQEYVNKGYIANIDEIYDYVYTDEGNKTLKDKLLDEVSDFGLMGQTPQQGKAGDKHYWVVPWTAPSTGIAYNVNMLKSLGGRWADGSVPKTVTEFLQLLTDLKAGGKTAFAWGGDGTNMGYWNFMFMSLWASYQGYDQSFEDGKAKYGSMLDFYEFEDENGNMDSGYNAFDQAGRKIALKAIQDMIVDLNNKTWKNSISDPVSKTVYQAQNKFAFEEAAMIVTGSWVQNEIADYIEPGFSYAMMPFPAIDKGYVQSVATEIGLTQNEIRGGLFTDGSFETLTNTGKTYAVMNNTEVGDVMFVPKNAVHKEKAIKFLIYLNKQENINKSTQNNSIARPFDYQPSMTGTYTDFTKSVFNIFESANTVQIVRHSESSVFTYAAIKEWADFNEADILLQLYAKSAKELIAIAYEKASDNWYNWLEIADV